MGNQFEYDSMPNHGPEACAMGVWDGKKTAVAMNLIDDMDNYYDTMTEQYCINGHYGCWGDDELYTNVGNVPEKKACELKSNIALQKNANFAVEYDGQDKFETEEYDEVAEIIKKVSVVNEDKIEKNENQHDKKKFGDSTAIDADAGNGGKGNGNKRDDSEKKDYAQTADTDDESERKNKHRDRKEDVDVSKYLSSESEGNNGYYWLVIGVASLVMFVLFACATVLCGSDKSKYDEYAPIMKELRKTFNQYDSTSDDST